MEIFKCRGSFLWFKIHLINRAVKHIINLKKRKKGKKACRKGPWEVEQKHWSPSAKCSLCKCQHVFFTAQDSSFHIVSPTVKQRVTTTFLLCNKELDYLCAIWPAGVSQMKRSNLCFQTQINDCAGCSKPQWHPAQRQVSGARCNWLLSFSAASEGPVTSQPISAAAMAVTVQGEAWRKDSVACETYGAQSGLLNHQVVAPAAKYVHVLRFWCTGQKIFLFVESCGLQGTTKWKQNESRQKVPYWFENHIDILISFIQSSVSWHTGDKHSKGPPSTQDPSNNAAPTHRGYWEGSNVLMLVLIFIPGCGFRSWYEPCLLRDEIAQLIGILGESTAHMTVRAVWSQIQ